MRNRATWVITTAAAAVATIVPAAFVSGQAAPAVPAEPARAIPADALRADLVFVRTTLRSVPGLYRYISPAALDRRFAVADAALTAPLTEVAFYRILAPIIAAIGHGHMILRLSDAGQASQVAAPRLPLAVFLRDRRVYVLRDLRPGGDLAGAELLSVNGMPVARIVDRIAATTSIDARQAAMVNRLAGGLALSSALPRLLDLAPPFDLRVRKDGRTVSRVVQGDTGLGAKWSAQAPGDADIRERGPMRLDFQGGIAVLTIPHWDYDDAKPTPAVQLQAFMETIAQRRPKSLIIDIRDNGGGEEALATQLLSYLLARPFDYYRCAVFATDRFPFLAHAIGESAGYGDVIPKYLGPVSDACRRDGRFPLANRPNLGRQQPRAPHYGGPLYLLVNDGGFSTSVEFAAHVRSERRGMLIGGAPHGSYWANVSGITPTIALPNSKLQLDVPLILYLHALRAGPRPGGTIEPDLAVSYTVAERIGGEDKEMAAALRLANRAARR